MSSAELGERPQPLLALRRRSGFSRHVVVSGTTTPPHRGRKWPRRRRTAFRCTPSGDHSSTSELPWTAHNCLSARRWHSFGINRGYCPHAAEYREGLAPASKLAQALVFAMAGTCGNRTHPATLSRRRYGFEVRGGHQAPIRSRTGLSYAPSNTANCISSADFAQRTIPLASRTLQARTPRSTPPTGHQAQSLRSKLVRGVAHAAG